MLRSHITPRFRSQTSRVAAVVMNRGVHGRPWTAGAPRLADVLSTGVCFASIVVARVFCSEEEVQIVNPAKSANSKEVRGCAEGVCGGGGGRWKGQRLEVLLPFQLISFRESNFSLAKSLFWFPIARSEVQLEYFGPNAKSSSISRLCLEKQKAKN